MRSEELSYLIAVGRALVPLIFKYLLYGIPRFHYAGRLGDFGNFHSQTSVYIMPNSNHIPDTTNVLALRYS